MTWLSNNYFSEVFDHYAIFHHNASGTSSITYTSRALTLTTSIGDSITYSSPNIRLRTGYRYFIEGFAHSYDSDISKSYFFGGTADVDICIPGLSSYGRSVDLGYATSYVCGTVDLTAKDYTTIDDGYNSYTTNNFRTSVGVARATTGLGFYSATDSVTAALGVYRMVPSNNRNVVQVEADYDITKADSVICACSYNVATLIVNLKPVTGYINTGHVITIKKIGFDANTVRVNAGVGQTIEGSATLDLTAQNKYMTLVKYGTTFYKVGSN